MNSDKFKLRKIFAASFAFSIMAGNCSNAVDQTIENKPAVSVSEPSSVKKKLRHHERVLGKIVADEVVDAMVLGTCAFLGGNLVYNITRDVCQFIKKSKTIENFKISELSGSSICVVGGKIAIAFSLTEKVVDNNFKAKNFEKTIARISSANLYDGSKEQFLKSVTKIRKACVSEINQNQLLSVKYRDTENLNYGPMVRDIFYYMDKKSAENKAKLQFTTNTLFRFEDFDYSFKIKDANAINTLNENMQAIIDGSVSESGFDFSTIDDSNIEIFASNSKNSSNLKQKIKKIDGKNKFKFYQVPNENLVLIQQIVEK